MTATRLTLADQALANALAFLCVQVVEDSRTALALDLLAQTQPATSNSPHVRPLREAAAEVLRTARARNRKGGSVPWAQAMLTAHAAVAAFLFWRASLAADAFEASQPKGETHAAE